MPAEGPLSGVRVLDLSTMIAAPLTASLLADYGADVVKVEHPGDGDHVRRFGPQVDGHGLYWKALGRGKRSVALDLHLPAVQELLRQWVPRFDVLVENFRPGTLERWGLGPEVLHAAAPGLVVLRVTAYGQDGPYRDRPGFGTLAESMTGIVALSRDAEGRPQLPPYALADVLAGHLGASAVLAALTRRAGTGRGDCIDLAIYEAALKLVELPILEQSQAASPGRTERAASAAPRGTYRCRDGQWLAMAASTQSVAERVLECVGGAALRADPRFRTNADRVRHRAELDALISAWCAARDRADAVEELTRMHCAVGPVETVETMLVNPQVVARGAVREIADPELGLLRMTAPVPRFAADPLTPPAPGPSSVGEHTLEVLRKDLGLSGEQLRDRGIPVPPLPGRPAPPAVG